MSTLNPAGRAVAETCGGAPQRWARLSVAPTMFNLVPICGGGGGSGVRNLSEPHSTTEVTCYAMAESRVVRFIRQTHYIWDGSTKSEETDWFEAVR